MEAGPDPKENSIQTTSSLHAFVGENAMFVYDLVVTLDTTQAIIVELEKP
jgi:hypothetical protein